MKRSPRNRKQKLIAVAFGLCIALLICETALRLVGYSYPEFYAADEDLGYSLIPGMSGRYQKEGASYVSINSHAQRDAAEHDIENREGNYRIAVLGDSYAEAFQVEADEAFWQVMEAKMNAAGGVGGRTVEVLNFGVSGYGTAQELLMMRTRALQFRPDLVLLAFTTNNDVTDNSRAFKNTHIPYFEIEDGVLRQDDSFRNTSTFRIRNSALGRAGTWLSNNLRTVQAVRRSWTAARVLIKSASAGGDKTGESERPASTEAPVKAVGDLGIDNQIYLEPTDAKWRSAWEVTENLVNLMRNEAEQNGAEFLVVTLSNGVQVWPDPEVRRSFAKQIGAADLFYPDNRMAAFCQSNGISVLTLAPHLADHAETHRVFLHGFDPDLGNGHWNPAGHRAAGEKLAEELKSRLNTNSE